MGRIRTKFVKRMANRFLFTHKNEFTEKFDDNKVKVQQLSDVSTKKLRNMIAGYITKLVKTGID